MADSGMTESEMKIVAATTRAGLARLREFNGLPAPVEAALDATDAWLLDFSTNVTGKFEAPEPMECERYDRYFRRLISAFEAWAARQ